MHETPLHAWHVAHGGRIVDFAGWAMPVRYSTITDEHHAVRTAAGLFDISHMGRIYLFGPDAVTLAERLVSCRVSTMKYDQVRYALITNEAGGILDDVLVYGGGDGSDRGPMLVVNASNREKMLHWIEQQRGDLDIDDPIDDPFGSAMLAVQGPASAAILSPLAKSQIASISWKDISELRYYRFTAAEIFGIPTLVSRTGYTGEDGFELIVTTAQGMAVSLYEQLLEAGKPHGLVPCGLGCRDTLRLEAGMPLYGHELTEEIDPITAGLSFAVALDKEFIGRDAIEKIAERGPERVRVGLKLAGKRIAREGTPLLAGDRPAGVVTSGTFSPTLQASLAMGYVPAEFAQPGTSLEADLRGKREPATVVSLPFYRRK